MKKRRLYAKNYSPLRRHSRTHEHLPVRTKSIHDSRKGRDSKQSYSKLQPNNRQFNNGSCLKKDAFGSLESLFDVKKPLNLLDVYQLAFDYCNDKSIKGESIDVFDNYKSEPLVKTLFLQSPLPRAHFDEPIYFEKNVKDELKASTGLYTEASDSAKKLQQINLIYNKEHYTVNMAENEGEIPEEQKEEAAVEEPVGEDVAVEDLKEEIKDEEADEREDKDEVKDEVMEEAIIDGKDEINDKIEDLQKEPPIFSFPPGIAEELKKLDERCNILNVEIQQIRDEVLDLSEKPDLTEEETLLIKEKQDALIVKMGELEQLTEQSRLTMQKALDVPYDDLLEPVEIFDTEEIEKQPEEEKIDIEVPKIQEKDRFELPRIEYPEDKLPRVIICGPSENKLPKIVIADSERKGRGKCFERLTGQLTESLTMQEKLVKENAQLEGGKYKLEEALLEKDAAIDDLEKKVCGLQAEMRMIVKENKELSSRLATLSQLMTNSTCGYASPGVNQTSQLTSPSIQPHSHANMLPRHDPSCQCKCCSRQPQFTDTSMPTTGTVCCTISSNF